MDRITLNKIEFESQLEDIKGLFQSKEAQELKAYFDSNRKKNVYFVFISPNFKSAETFLSKKGL